MYVRVLMGEFEFPLLWDCTGARLGFIPRFRSGQGAEPAWCEGTEASYNAAGGETLEAANSHLGSGGATWFTRGKDKSSISGGFFLSVSKMF